MAELSDKMFLRPALDDPSEQIRLLQIDHNGLARLDDPLRCSLSVHSVDEVDGKYVAVSYCWGPPEPTGEIFVDGQPCTVRLSCQYALSQMRMHKVATFYWIDSICIDQECHREKQEQVGQMGSIFSRAKLVAACLGPPGPDEELFSVIMDTIRSQNERHRLAEAVKYFLRRPYFRRLWIVQECLLARKLDAFCGRRRLSWEGLRSIIFHPWNSADAEYLDQRDNEEEELLNFFQDCAAQPRESAQIQAGLDNLHCAVVRYSKRECYDPRDKIYGLVSLARHQFKAQICIDYDKALVQVLIDYVYACREFFNATYSLAESIDLLVQEFASSKFNADTAYEAKNHARWSEPRDRHQVKPQYEWKFQKDLQALISGHGSLDDSILPCCKMYAGACTEPIYIRRSRCTALKLIQRIEWHHESLPNRDSGPESPFLFDAMPCKQSCSNCSKLIALASGSNPPILEHGAQVTAAAGRRIIALPLPHRARFAVLEIPVKHEGASLTYFEAAPFTIHHDSRAHSSHVHLGTFEDFMTFVNRDPRSEDFQPIKFLGTLRALCANKRPLRSGFLRHTDQDIMFTVAACPCEVVSLSLIDRTGDSGIIFEHNTLQGIGINLRHVPSAEKIKWNMICKGATEIHLPAWQLDNTETRDQYEIAGITAQD